MATHPTVDNNNEDDDDNDDDDDDDDDTLLQNLFSGGLVEGLQSLRKKETEDWEDCPESCTT